MYIGEETFSSGFQMLSERICGASRALFYLIYVLQRPRLLFDLLFSLIANYFFLSLGEAIYPLRHADFNYVFSNLFYKF